MQVPITNDYNTLTKEQRVIVRELHYLTSTSTTLPTHTKYTVQKTTSIILQNNYYTDEQRPLLNELRDRYKEELKTYLHGLKDIDKNINGM